MSKAKHKHWRKRTLGAVLGLSLGWIAAGYAPGALHHALETPPSQESTSEPAQPIDEPSPPDPAHE